MRLIDKDLVLKTAKDKEWGLWCEIVNIKFAPEVDAIPIEWLRMWFSKNGYLSGMALVDKIESDWKEENEQNKESTSQTD